MKAHAILSRLVQFILLQRIFIAKLLWVDFLNAIWLTLIDLLELKLTLMRFDAPSKTIDFS